MTTEIPSRLRVKGIKFVLLEKGGKKPFQLKWQDKVIEFDNPELIAHLEAGGNYGIMGGGGKKLIVIDFDNAAVQDDAMKKLPETFTVKSGRGMLHIYYFSDRCDSFKIFDEEMNTFADIQGEGKQVVGPGSVHPNGNRYEVVKDIDIVNISYAELRAIMMSYDKKPRKKSDEQPPREIHKDKHIEDNFIDDVKRKVSMEDVLRHYGVDTTRNPTQCPLHASSGGKCLGFKNETCHCFHCEGSFNIFSLVMEKEKCDFKGALEFLAKNWGMEKELNESRQRYIERIRADSRKEYDKAKTEFMMLTTGKEKNWGAASEMLAKFIEEKMWIVTTKDDIKSEMWVYKDGIYTPQGRSEIKEFLRNLLGEYYSQFIYGLVMAKIEPDTFDDYDHFFKTSYPNEVPVMNGILNIRTRELSEFNPNKIFFNKMPVEYRPECKCPKIDKFFRDVLKNEEDVNILYEMVGYGLLDEYKFEKAFMLHGEGRNGKGRSIMLIKKLFGVENCVAVSLMSLKSDNFSLSELFGKRLNLAGDIGNQDLKETNMFKSLTGRDLITAKRKFLKDLHFENNAKFVFACNELPMVYDLTKGFWERWILLDYPYTFVSKEEYDAAPDKSMLKLKDEDILQKISTPDELSGLLNASLDALDKLEKNKMFSTTKGSEEVKSTWIRKSNSFVAFCWDNIEDNYDGRISKKDLRKKYAEYCKQHKVPAKSDFVIKKVLQETYGAVEIRGGYDSTFGMRNDSWEGIAFKNIIYNMPAKMADNKDSLNLNKEFK